MFKVPAVFDSAALTWSATGDAALRGATVRSTPYRWVTLLATLRDAVGSTPATPAWAARSIARPLVTHPLSGRARRRARLAGLGGAGGA